MKVLIMCLTITIMFLMSSCEQPNNAKLTGTQPPAAKVQIENQVYETKLGTYCWNSGCVDAVGPVELLKGKSPISVAPGEVIKFVMEYEPQPNKFHAYQIHNNENTEIMFDNLQFNAPTQEGVYYYTIGVWWLDEKRENVSNGDAFYYFVIDVN